MRPLAIAALFLAAAPLSSCSPTCTATSLRGGLDALTDRSPASVARLAAASCKLPEPLAAWALDPASPPPTEAWAAACPDIALPAANAPQRHARQTVYQGCGVADLDLADAQTFAHADGLPWLAVALTRALASNEDIGPALAADIGRAVLGQAPPAWAAWVDVPKVEVGSATPPAAWITLTTDGLKAADTALTLAALRDAPPTGATGHALPEELALAPHRGTALAASGDVPVEVLHRVAATLATEGTLDLVVMATRDGLEDLPHALPIGVPDAAPALGLHAAPGGFVVRVDGADLPPQPGCPTAGPTTCAALGEPLSAAIALLPERAGAPVGLDLGRNTPLNSWIIAGERLRVRGLLPALDPTFAPCVASPSGMVCVPGGYSRVGDVGVAPGDGPALVALSTFYMDGFEATSQDYARCVEAGGCESARLPSSPTAPAENLSHVQAEMFCAFAGKRLPTEWEWERAARLDQIDLDCDYARTRACPVGQPSTAGRLGLHDLFGSVAEFTSSMPLNRGETCGDDCTGRDPLGPCDGAPMCKGRLSRVVRGASRASAVASPNDRGALGRKRAMPNHGVRCVSREPVLQTFPPAWVQAPPPEPAPPAPITQEQRAILAGIAQDDIDQIPVCDDGRRGSSRTDCKDPTHYIYPNEDRAHITYPYLVNRGGALLGVGSDQNYTFAALARSELVFLLDYDAMVVYIHRINQAFIKASDTPDAFVARWAPANLAEGQELIAKEWADDPKVAAYQRLHRSLARTMHGHYQRTRAPSQADVPSWLSVEAHYAWIRDLWRAGRVVALEGDMMGPNAMLGAARACEQLGVPMRIYYTSNAPNAWGGEMTEGYRRNVRAFPMDERSIVLQALGWTNEFGQTGHWHYNVQRGLDVQERLALPGYVWLWQVVRPYRPSDDVDLSLSGLPATWDDAHRP